MLQKSNISPLLLVFGLVVCSNLAHCSCRLGSDELKSYAKQKIQQLLDVDMLESIYWTDEPLDSGLIGKAFGLNVTFAETHFDLSDQISTNSSNVHKNFNEITSKKRFVQGGSQAPFIRDMYVTCAFERDQRFLLATSVEFENPFQVIDIHHVRQTNAELKRGQIVAKQTDIGKTENEMFHVLLPESTFIVQLVQRNSYDKCLEIEHVQLASSVSYEVDCPSCNEERVIQLTKALNRRSTQLDAELDYMLSEKILLGLQVLFSQQRLELDTFLI